MSVITLSTDFGLADPYAGIMKGVILSINPSVAIVDLTHCIDPQDTVSAAYMIESAYSYFPEKTVHVVVVDPGVGTGRAVIAAEASGRYFLAPDNGVLGLVLKSSSPAKIVRVENEEYFLTPVSRTFHGRDIFAPVAACISRGVPLERFGPSVSASGIFQPEIPQPRVSGSGELEGRVISVDRFGNLITNLDEKSIQRLENSCSNGSKCICIQAGSCFIRGISASYRHVPEGGILALIGSRGFLEISVNMGNASEFCGQGKGSEVRVFLCSPAQTA